MINLHLCTHLLLICLPTPFTDHPGLFRRGFGLAVLNTRCCMSLHVRAGLKSSVKVHSNSLKFIAYNIVTKSIRSTLVRYK